MANIFGVSICKAKLRFSTKLSKNNIFFAKHDIQIKMGENSHFFNIRLCLANYLQIQRNIGIENRSPMKL
ncbi:hypothetical protein DI53_3192 [Sphingobacterium deserti]|uniref:Uncharacterized protein n=1 Tax=Sphingobacterium deserti TaxID=1229276 RepID=A0A0B8T6M0_9SPHI|nr:hypothetical protein DI53_3192 [Sphingobacterium deserti]